MSELDQVLGQLAQTHPNEKQFYQAVHDVLSDVMPYISDKKHYLDSAVIERLLVPDKIIEFRVSWQSGDGQVHVNRGWRVQHNNALGAYKGGLRFHPTVSLDTFKFLAFEQTFKNALTGLPMGGGKGGSDFDPKGKSDADILRFCQAFMLKLSKYIGPEQDVPAGDIGVGAREIGYLFGAYKKITGVFNGVLTGKGETYGGSNIRKEATGYGSVYFVENILSRLGDDLKDKRCLVSGSGNVAIYTVEKLLHKNAKVLTMSDSRGTIVCEQGLTEADLAEIKRVKEVERGSLESYASSNPHISYRANEKPWSVACDVAIPCATQNELDATDAKALHENGVAIIAEAANMPLTSKAIDYLTERGVIVAPGKAVNAGGVAVSGLERTQNALMLSWDSETVDKRLKEIMRGIHDHCVRFGRTEGKDTIDYIKGANIGGFIKVAEAMVQQGVS